MEEKKKQTEPEACKVAKKCGGCQYQGVPYKEQLKKKQKMVNALLSKYGKVEPIIGMENPYYYRNKVHAVFDVERRGKHANGGRRTAGNGHAKAAPGGVISGTALIRPDFPELLEFPYLWQQGEYVLGGGSSDYMFLVLAARKVLLENKGNYSE